MFSFVVISATTGAIVTHACVGHLATSFAFSMVVLGSWIAGLSFAGLTWALDVASAGCSNPAAYIRQYIMGWVGPLLIICGHRLRGARGAFSWMHAVHFLTLGIEVIALQKHKTCI